MAASTRPMLRSAAALAIMAAVTGPLVPLLGAALAAVAALLIGVTAIRRPEAMQEAAPTAKVMLGHLESALDALSDAQAIEGDPARLRLLYTADAAVVRAAGAAEDALAVAGQPALGTDPEPMAIIDVIRVALAGLDDLSAVRVDTTPLLHVDGCRARPLARLIGRLVEGPGNQPLFITTSATGEGAVLRVSTPAPVGPVELALAAAAGATAETDDASVSVRIGPDLLIGHASQQQEDGDDAAPLPEAEQAEQVPPPAPEGEQASLPELPQQAAKRRSAGLLSLFGRNHHGDVGWTTRLRSSVEPTQSQLAGFVNDFVPAEPEPEPTAKVGERLPPPVPAFTQVNQQVKRGEVAEDYVPPTVDGPLMDLIADLPSAVPQMKRSSADSAEANALPVREVRVAAPTLMADMAAELEGLL